MHRCRASTLSLRALSGLDEMAERASLNFSAPRCRKPQSIFVVVGNGSVCQKPVWYRRCGILFDCHGRFLHELLLRSWRVGADVLVAFFGDRAAAGGAFEKSELHEVRFVDLLDGRFLFRERCGDGFEAHRPAVEFLDDDGEDIAVGLIQARLVYLQKRERFFHGLDVQGLFAHFRKVTRAFEKIIRGARRRPTSAGDFSHGFFVCRDAEYLCGAPQYLRDLIVGVVREAERATGEAATQRGGEHRDARRRRDERERGKFELDRARGGTFADDDIENTGFHRGGEDFFNSAVQTVYLVYKEDVALRKIRKNRGEVARALDGGTGCGAQRRPDLLAHEVCERRFTQSGRAVEEHMLRLMIPALRGGEENAQILFYRRLADVLLPTLRPECLIERTGALFKGFFVFVGHTFEALLPRRSGERRLF